MTHRSADERRYTTIVERLKDADHRLTPQRLAIIELLTHADYHPSAQQLHQQLLPRFPSTSLATVYKTLHILTDLGEVLELGFSDDDTRYDARTTVPHIHLICVQCRRIIDTDIQPDPHLIEQLKQHSGYRILGHRIEFYGLCPDCQDNSGT
jgi:Fur family transcriptional regulator, peroxide stress response regulator